MKQLLSAALLTLVLSTYGQNKPAPRNAFKSAIARARTQRFSQHGAVRSHAWDEDTLNISTQSYSWLRIGSGRLCKKAAFKCRFAEHAISVRSPIPVRQDVTSILYLQRDCRHNETPVYGYDGHVDWVLSYASKSTPRDSEMLRFERRPYTLYWQDIDGDGIQDIVATFKGALLGVGSGLVKDSDTYAYTRSSFYQYYFKGLDFSGRNYSRTPVFLDKSERDPRTIIFGK